MYAENFNTLKKGPHWNEFKHSSPIEPPLEFQDKPKMTTIETFASNLTSQIISKAFREFRDSEPNRLKLLSYLQRPVHHFLARPYWTPDFIPFSPCHANRPSSRSSLGSSRLSSSHNSLSVPTAHKIDDSSFITQAVSHDTLSSNQIRDLYNVPFDSDVYAVPIDVVRPPLKPKRIIVLPKKRRRNTACCCKEIEVPQPKQLVGKKLLSKPEARVCFFL